MSSKNSENKPRLYRITIVDHDSHKQLSSWKLSRNSFFMTVITLIVLLFVISFAIIGFTPLRTLLPGYPFGETRKEAIQTAMTIDSLENVIRKWSFYSENLRRVVEGEAPIPIDSIIRNDAPRELGQTDQQALARQDSTLREIVTESEKFVLNRNKEKNMPIEGKHFFTPLKGVVSRGYTAVIHPYIDISAPANSVVMAALDGTVIHSDWSDETGYTIEIQHMDDIITVYKHNQKLLKNAGDKVKAGTPIALVGDTGSMMDGDHLHFELWYRGEALDPTRYIKF